MTRRMARAVAAGLTGNCRQPVDAGDVRCEGAADAVVPLVVGWALRHARRRGWGQLAAAAGGGRLPPPRRVEVAEARGVRDDEPGGWLGNAGGPQGKAVS